MNNTDQDESNWVLWEGQWKSQNNPNFMYGLVYINLPLDWNEYKTFSATAVVDYMGAFKSGMRLQIPVKVNLERESDGFHTMNMKIKLGPSKIQYNTTVMMQNHIAGTYSVSFPQDAGIFDMKPSETGEIPYKDSSCQIL